ITEEALKLATALSIAGPRSLTSRLFQHQMALPFDERPYLFGEQAEQPRQLHFDAHVIVGDIDRAGSRLAQNAGAEIEMIAGPVLVDHRELLAECRAGAAESGFQAACRLLLAELMRDGNDERFGHGRFQMKDI